MNNGHAKDQGEDHSLNNDKPSTFSDRPTSYQHQRSPWWRQAWDALLTPTPNPRFPPGPLQRPIIGYLAAILLQVIIGIGVILLTHAYPTLRFPGGLILLAVPLTALIWGSGPSILAVFGGAILFTYLRLSHYFSQAGVRPADIVSLFLYLIIGLTISLLASQTQNTRYRAALETYRLRRYYEELVAQFLTERQARQASEQKMQMREKQLEALLEISTDALFILDLLGAVPQMNEAAKRLLDLPPDSELNPIFEHLFDLLDTSGNPLPRSAWPGTRLLKGERLHEKDAEVLIRTQTGKIRPVTITGMPVRDADNVIVGAVLICRDATAQPIRE